MSESDENKDLLEALNSVNEVKIGDVVKGEVLAIDDAKQVIVGIEGAGVEGVVPFKELSLKPDQEVSDDVTIGDVIDLVVISRIGSDKEGGSYLLSQRRLEARKIWDDIEKKFEAGETITAPVTQVVKGGLVVDAGVRGFIPASMVDDRFVEDLNQYKNQELELKIIEIEPSENRLILSHKEIVKAAREAKKAETLANLVVGDVVEGKVARLTSFGAFVDLGGVDGLVHVSEISYERVNKPSDVLKVGETVKVKVLSIDTERDRISLSIKQTLPQPWDNITEKVAEGDVLEGTVKRLTSFGAFVEVFPGVEGLVHISQISHKHIATPNEVLTSGETIKVKVLNVHADEHRLALSVKALEEKPSAAGEAKKEKAPEGKVDLPDESTGFTLGDLVGDLKDEDHQD
ncbi:30S ribosomal protein S1 [Liquorilactobacillus mali]|uniref:30S ribosomal protein S1 n=1 Tax=Liquorilactobacillus mali KCTC 3596 = DSM 20444 TaxID=1046596 RepID=J1F1S0_9LACO|nr:30S ribosomal protein S1 [Liquorilactobacillus mali]EJE98463.1 30S ribosomal protein S1 [Liquorilactobacillus mali KCTC 3596 = DSM 20444]KRN09564.1 30S ribosomal protein S1 [Liquorilactobacillus mali KCTC 3596 = DSM 20444]MDC7952165.1 30S ribosomal protein S1 [Liquorilactobacillus mali]MDV7756906.1 30S ribosomal protein S1 [Liquorilactobacillus mali]QFQ74746.1 30S ribosomal protein S1 [Liquorilactobacillus mali]